MRIRSTTERGLGVVATATLLIAMATVHGHAINPALTPFLAQTSWPSTHGDSRNSDYSPYASVAALQQKWTALAGATTLFAPTIGPEGNLYVTTGRGAGHSHLHAFDRDGNVLWESPPQVDADSLDSGALASAPIVDVDGDLYVGDSNQLWAFESDGTLKWVADLPEADAPIVSPIITNDGLVGGITVNGKLVLHDRASGLLAVPVLDLPGGAGPPASATPPGLWGNGLVDVDLIDTAYAGLFGGEYEVANTPAVHPETGRIFITASSSTPDEGALYGIDIHNGTPVVALKATTDAGSGTSPAISPDGKQVYAVAGESFEGVMTAFNSASGTILWEVDGAAAAASPTVGPDGTIYTGAGTGFVTALAPDKGSELWSRGFDDLATSMLPTVADFPPLVPSGVPVSRVNSVVTASGNQLLAVVTLNYVFINPGAGVPTLPIVHKVLLVSLSPSDGTLNGFVELHDVNEGVVSIAKDGSVYVSHAAIFSSVMYYGLNGLLPAELQQPFAPVAGVSAYEPVSFVDLATQGAAWSGECSRQAKAALDQKKPDIDHALISVRLAIGQLQATADTFTDSAAAGQLGTGDAATRRGHALDATDHLLDVETILTTPGNSDDPLFRLDEADFDIGQALDGLACDDGNVCTSGTTFAGSTCNSATVAPILETKLKVKVAPGTEKDKMTIKATFALTDLTTDPLVDGLTIQANRAVPYGDAHTFFSGTVPGSAFDDRKGDGTRLFFKDKEGLTPGTNGITQAQVRLNTKKNEVDIKAKVVGAQTAGAASSAGLGLAFLVGTDPMADTCVADPVMPCTPKSRSVRCLVP